MRPSVCLFVVMCCVTTGLAQQASPATSVATDSAVPALVNFTGILSDANGKPLNNVTGVTFLLYKDSQGGAPLWMETQNIQPDKTGHYTVMLGSTTSQGLPQDVFVNGEARWLGVQVVGDQEQPRVLLVAVPYALKAGDAETIGGLPPSAFVLANAPNGSKGNASSANSSTSTAAVSSKNSVPANPAVTGKGTVDFIPMWDSTSDIINSLIFQKSSHVGINTTAPASTLDVNGKSIVRDTLTLLPNGTDPTLAIGGTAFKVDQTGKVTFVNGQKFPGAGTITGVTTATGSGLTGGGTSGTLNLGLTKTCTAKQVLQWNGTAWACSAAGTGTITGVTTPNGTGLSGGGTSGTLSLGLIQTCTANEVLQWNGTSWACSSAGSGTITGVTTASGSGLTGGGTNGTLNLSIDPAFVPGLAAANTFTNTNLVNVNSGSAALTVENATGDGLDIYPGPGSDGVYIGHNSGQYGIVAYGGSADGGYFNGPVAGSYSVNTTDGNGSAAAYGEEFGSTQITYGVVGYSASNFGIGTYGQAVSPSHEGASVVGYGPIGVWGDSGDFNSAAILATADDGFGLIAYNTGDSMHSTALFQNDETVDPNFVVLTTYGSAFNGACNIDVSGNLTCRGTKSAVVPVDGGAREVALYAVESPENWFEDFGSGQLSNGAVTISLEDTFRQTVNTDTDYHVFLTPNGDSRGLYVAQKTATSFEVREQGGGTSSIAFDYRIVARRKGYEQIRLADKTQLMNMPRPKRTEGHRAVMPTELDKHKAHEPGLRSAVFARKPVAKNP